MTLIEAARRPLRRLTSFTGRSTRREFWSFLFVLWLLVAALAVALRAAAPEALIYVFFPVLICEYALLWAVTVRRLHDTNRSGYALLVAMVPFIGLVALIIWLASPSDPGSNPYGTHPDDAYARAGGCR